MSDSQGKIDLPACREDLVRKAAESTCRLDFDWLDDKVANRVASDGNNRGLTANEIKDYAREWIRDGNKIWCKQEGRQLYKDRRHFWYYVIVKGLDSLEFQRGLFVEMELRDPDEDTPAVSLLNAHPPSYGG